MQPCWGSRDIIPQADADKIVAGLQGHPGGCEGRQDHLVHVDAEDIHMNVETLLTQRIGDAGKRLHTGRSRNDQVRPGRTHVRTSWSCVETRAAA